MSRRAPLLLPEPPGCRGRCPRSLPRLRAPVAARDFLSSPSPSPGPAAPFSSPYCLSPPPHGALPFGRDAVLGCRSAMLRSPLPRPCERTRCCCTALRPPSALPSSLRTCLCIGRAAAP